MGKRKEEIELLENINPEVSARFIKEFKAKEQVADEIVINIGSYGGIVKDAWDIISVIQNSKVPTTSIITSIAASAASIIAISADKVKMRDYALMMIHAARPLVEGANSEMVDAYNQQVKLLYSKKSRLSEEKINQLMSKDSWFLPGTALEFGLIDEIIETNQRETIKQVSQLFEAVMDVEKNNDSIYLKELNKIYSQVDIKTQNKIKMNEIFKVLNLSDATEETALDAIKNLQKLQVTNEAFKQEITNKDTVIADLNSQLEGFKAKEKAQKDLLATELVEKAISEKKIKSDSRSTWVTLAQNDYEATKTALNSISAMILLSDQIEVEKQETEELTQAQMIALEAKKRAGLIK